MPTKEAVFNNYARFVVEAQVDVSAAAAVTATRGEGLTTTKTGAGAYSTVLKAGGGIKLVAIYQARADIQNPTSSSAKSARVTGVTQNADTGDITVTWTTSATLGGAAADNSTAAMTVNLEVVLQTARMTNPLA